MRSARTGDNTVAILGGKGMLGTDLVKACRKEGYKVRVFDLPEFDVTNTAQLEQAVRQAETVINCAAYTNVDKAESESELAYKVNAQAVGNLGVLAKKTQKWVLHIGTDFVFDGKSDKPYVETDVANPINIYGKSKLAGEQLLAKSGCDYCIIRVQWTYGQAGNNFVTKLIGRARRDKNIKVVDDQIGSPTTTTEIAKAICQLLPQRPQGLFHFAAAGCVSRFEMAEFIFKNLNMSVNLTACKSSDFLSAAARPLNSRFDCGKIQALLEEPIESWQGPLKLFLEQL
jgi:dTDP-4-dehydrorhamnose reductase